MMDVKISDFYFMVIVANKTFSVEWSSHKFSFCCLNVFLTDVQVSCQLLNGERVEYEGAAEGSVMTLTNYRLHIRIQDNIINVSVCVMIRLSVYSHTEMCLIYSPLHQHMTSVFCEQWQEIIIILTKNIQWPDKTKQQKESHNDDWHDLCSLFDMCWCVSGSSSAGWERRMSWYDSTSSHL